MRRHLIATLAAMMLIVGAVSFLVAQTSTSAEVMLEAAKQMELLDGDLEAAIAQYEAIVSRYPDQRSIVAEALLHMGSGYEKLGQARARDVYEQLVRDYADQAEPVAAARSRLEALGGEPAVPPPTMTVRELMRSGQHEFGVFPATAPAVSRDGQFLVYTDWSTGDLSRLHVATGDVQPLFDTDWNSDSFFELPVFSPDEERVAFVRFPNGLDAGGGTRIEVSALGGQNREVVHDFKEMVNGVTYDWSPDGATILLAADASDGTKFLGTLDIEHKRLRRLLTLDWQFPQRAQYSPDGRFIAYDSTKDGDSKIYLVSPDGAQERVLVESSGNNDSPTWTRDGRFLLFRSDRSGKWDLYALPMQDGQAAGRATVVMSLGEITLLRGITEEDQLFYSDLVDGQGVAITGRIDEPTETVPARLLPKAGTTEIKSPNFSPDGQRLGYLAGPSGAPRTARVTDLQGTVLREIPLDGVTSAVDQPMFSPDGRKLAFRVYRRGGPTIAVVSVDTETVVKAFSPYETGYVRILGWTPDGHNLLALFVDTGTRSIDTIDIEGERVVASISLNQDVAGLARLSPSGEQLLLEVGGRIVLRSLTDGRERQLGVGQRPIWDFDSRRVFFRKLEEGPCCESSPPLYSISLDTGEETILVDDMKGFRLAAVSSDGKYWAFQNDVDARDHRMMVLENFLPDHPVPAAGQSKNR